MWGCFGLGSKRILHSCLLRERQLIHLQDPRRLGTNVCPTRQPCQSTRDIAYGHGEIIPSLGPLTTSIVTRSNDSDSLSTVRVAIWVGASRVGTFVIDGDTVGSDGLITAKDGERSVSKRESTSAEGIGRNPHGGSSVGVDVVRCTPSGMGGSIWSSDCHGIVFRFYQSAPHHITIRGRWTYCRGCRRCWWYRQTSSVPIHRNHQRSGTLQREPVLLHVPLMIDDDSSWIVFRHDGIRARERIGEGMGGER
jgi:hypothetical protein